MSKVLSLALMILRVNQLGSNSRLKKREEIKVLHKLTIVINFRPCV